MKTDLMDIADKLLDRYGTEKHWEIVKAEKTEHGWTITVQPAEENDGGATNESDK